MCVHACMYVCVQYVCVRVCTCVCARMCVHMCTRSAFHKLATLQIFNKQLSYSTTHIFVNYTRNSLPPNYGSFSVLKSLANLFKTISRLT